MSGFLTFVVAALEPVAAVYLHDDGVDLFVGEVEVFDDSHVGWFFLLGVFG
jgi:hypothetical protein